ncbi:MAG TPA: O-antigen ligase family protein [Burkholderiales bacterium]
MNTTRNTWWLVPAGTFLFILPFTHTVALRLLALFTAFGIAVWQWWPARTPALPGSLPAWRWIAFWALLPLALAVASRDPAYSIGEWKTEVVYGMLALTTFFVMVRSEMRLRQAVGVLLAAFLVLTVWAIAARLHYGIWNEASRFGGTGTFSTYLVTVMPILAVAGAMRLGGRRTGALIALLAALGLATGLFTGQRGLWMAIAVQGLVLAVVLRMTGLWRPRNAVFPVVLVVILILSFAAMQLASTLRFGTDAGFGADSSTGSGQVIGVDPKTGAIVQQDPRLANWWQVLERVVQEPLTGHGFGRGMMAKAYPEMKDRPDMFWHAHNLVLDYGIQLGIPGLVAILGLFGALLVHWMRLARSSDALVRAIGIAGVLLVVGVFARNMTNDFFQRDLSLLFWALTGLLAGAAHARGAGR